MIPLSVRFDRGTLRFSGNGDPSALPGVLWDPRTECFRAPAWLYGALVDALSDGLVDEARRRVLPLDGVLRPPPLRAYQDHALVAWRVADRRGVVVLPTGAGKTRVAVAAIVACSTATLVLCPTRALLAQWTAELREWYGGAIGVLGDGERSVDGITVSTFESAWRRAEEIGDRFGLVVIDEAHHLGGTLPSETLEMCTARWRLALTATMPAEATRARVELERLVGPVVCDVALTELVGTHLAELERIRLRVGLDDDEREAYERDRRPFLRARAAFAREFPRADWQSLMRHLARSREGRDAIAGLFRANALAGFPRAKRILANALIERHRRDRTLVFTARCDDAIALGLDQLVPVITAETSRGEREEILSRFRDGTYGVVASARVLNEGIDVPDAAVAIVVGGDLGELEHIQRVGRTLRPAPGKRALVYELVTARTVDDRKAERRGGTGAARAAAARP